MAAPIMSGVACSGAVGLRRWRLDGAYPRVGGESRRCSRTVGDPAVGTAVRRVSESRRWCAANRDRESDGFALVGEGDGCLVPDRSMPPVSDVKLTGLKYWDPHVLSRDGLILNGVSTKSGRREGRDFVPACPNSIWC